MRGAREAGLEFGARIRSENGVDARDKAVEVKRCIHRYDLFTFIYFIFVHLFKKTTTKTSLKLVFKYIYWCLLLVRKHRQAIASSLS